MTRWHASYALGRPSTGISYGVEKYRVRKSVALTRDSPGLREVVAYFTSAENARRFVEEMNLGPIIEKEVDQ